MSQLDDFKRALGLDENFQEMEAVKAEPIAETSKERMLPKKKTQKEPRRTITLPMSTWKRLQLLGFWLEDNGLLGRGTHYDVINLLLDEYVASNARAAKYLKTH